MSCKRGIETFTSAESDLLIGIEQCLYKNDFAGSVLNNSSGKAEQSYWWTHPTTGLPCKCRCDLVIDDMVIDLKTCGEGLASPDKFMKTVVNFNYHLAAAHYLQGTGAKRFIFIAVEKVFPYSVGIYQLSQSFIEKGYELQEQTLQEILEATTTNSGEATQTAVQTESKHSPHPNGFNVTFEKDTKPKFEVMDITPDMAKKILAHRNKNNRPLRYTHLEKLSNAIEKDEWKVTHQGLAFDKDGNLIDGQHRLAAVLQTRKTVK